MFVYIYIYIYNIYTLVEFKRSREAAAIMLLSWNNFHTKLLK